MNFVNPVQRIACLSLLLFTVAATDSYAQLGGRGSTGGRSGMPDKGGNTENRGVRQPQPDPESFEQIDYRLSLLEEDLRLSPAQRPHWDIFAGKVRAFAGDVARERTRAVAMSAAAGSGIKYIEQSTDRARNHVTALEDIAIAAKALYANLSPNQVTLADMRIPTIVAPQPRSNAVAGSAYNLPNLGSADRPPR